MNSSKHIRGRKRTRQRVLMAKILKKLKELDPQFAMTCNIYNVWLHTRKVPNQIKDNRSILLPKETTDLDDENIGDHLQYQALCQGYTQTYSPKE